MQNLMTFYLGTHHASWLGRLKVPLFVSRRTLCDRKSLPRAAGDWVLDSGGFSELDKKGGWSLTAPQFAQEVLRYQREMGRLQWAPVMDWMCEPWILAKTGLSVAEHQRRTTVSYLELRQLAPQFPWTPVLQGWELADYHRHWEQYAASGVDLEALPVVGVGSVCRRQNTEGAERIIRSLAPLRLHAFGFKLTGLARCAAVLGSSDSMAWSLQARYRPPMFPECTHRNCANCERWALAWREKVIAAATGGQRAAAPQLSLAF